VRSTLTRGACSLALLATCVFALTARGAGIPLDEIRQVLREQSLTPPAESRLRNLDAADLNAGLQAIDPDARYFPRALYRSPNQGRDSMSGIGAELLPSGDDLWLLPFQGGAAAAAGLTDRARLRMIDGQSIAGWSLETIANRLRGSAGTRVVLGIEDPDGRARRLAIERQSFRPLDVELVQPGAHRLLRVREFVAGLTRSALLATVDFIENAGVGQSEQHPIILDLRDAAGGDLFEALDIAALFLPEGARLATLVARGGVTSEIRAPAGTDLDQPLILLIGPGTASAAEILAGILRDHGRARLVGQTTYGKCDSQTDVRLSDGSVLRFTNRAVRLPSGEHCSGVGITPDLEVDTATLNHLSRLVSRAIGASHVR
jgi:carboxyl-terminal processing protease